MIEKKIFIINGSGGVGKDTFVEQVKKAVGEKLPMYKDTCVSNYSSVDRVKEIAREIGWNGGKSERDRKFLSDLKLLCTEYCDLPFRDMQERVNDFVHGTIPGELFLFLHIREPEEIERAKRAFNAQTILVTNNRVEHIISNMADQNVFNYDYDYIIDNCGTISDLFHTAKSFVNVNCLSDDYEVEPNA